MTDHAEAIRAGLSSTGFPSSATIDAGLAALDALLVERDRYLEALQWIANEAGRQGCGMRECEEIASAAIAAGGKQHG